MSTAINTQSTKSGRGSGIENVITREQVQSLAQLTLELQRQLESFNQSQTSTIEGALDFYLEVQRFEIALIKQALRVAEGHQRKAAALLNLNSTTLNAMIKRYRIKLELLPDST